MKSQLKANTVTWVTKGSVRIELERKLGIIYGDIFDEAYNDTHMGEDIEDYLNRLSTRVDKLNKELR